MKVQGQLLTPFQRKLLQKSIQSDLSPEHRRRIEIMLLADAGQSKAQICAALKCSHETVRYWTAIALAGRAHKWDDCPIGRPKTVNSQYLNRLKELVDQSPREYGYPFQRWTAQWLGKHLAKETGIEVSDRHISRLLNEMGLSTRRRKSEKGSDLPSTKNSGIAIRDLQSGPPSTVPWPLAHFHLNS